MPSTPVLDFDALLSPIPGDPETGVYLRDDPENQALFYDVKGERDTAREAEEYVPDDESPDGPPPSALSKWEVVKQLCLTALTEKTKDLDFVAYLIEALLRTNGVAGLRDGFRLVRELCDRYWDTLYPPITGADGVYGRLALLGNLNGGQDEGTLVKAMDRIVIAAPGQSNEKTFLDYASAMAAAFPKAGKTGAARPAKPEKLEELRAVANSTDDTFYQTLAADMRDALVEVEAMGKCLDKHAKRDAPGTSKIRTKFGECLRILIDLAGDRLNAPPEASSDDPNTSESTGQTSGGGGGGGGRTMVSSGPIQGREDAFKTLLEVAKFFKQTEPHSVVSYSLEQVVKWGRMSLPELLKELIGDQAARDSLYERVGIPKEE